MRPEFFKAQWERLKTRFGPRAMDDEFGRLVLDVVREMSETGFKHAVDVWIGSRSHLKPPLLSEFREAQLNEAKRNFERDVAGAGRLLYHPAVAKPLREVLMRDFGAVDTVAEALEAARRKRRDAGKDGA